ncbi:hypothetical protein [Tepidibacter hydrothermalis]|uniref:HTH cro/C1-type domain-containing protein n=1 Tax=Tepidibacter hydrothermalis TaxID=3036126 RepID=A0ABY8ECS2_9FIRM|nr:hypothetical protein [Tepidibacter hydrothermalis]WFD10728.1 hypothetical protein P4S50_01245 [Tepidibacter hydrothermalis]
MEKRMVKTLKGLAKYFDISLGDLLEGIVLHSFEGKAPFSEKTLGKIEELKKIYEMELFFFFFIWIRYEYSGSF